MAAEYQNLFTRVQVHGPSYPGVPLERGNKEREGPPVHIHLLGIIGDGALGADADGQVRVIDFRVDVGEAAGEDEVVERRPFGVDFEAPGLAFVCVDELDRKSVV